MKLDETNKNIFFFPLFFSNIFSLFLFLSFDDFVFLLFHLPILSSNADLLRGIMSDLCLFVSLITPLAMLPCRAILILSSRARSENRMIFLSIGYSTCHWCHVMERESFENEQVSSFIEQLFWYQYQYSCSELETNGSPSV